MRFDLKTRAVHIKRGADASLAVHDEAALDDMHDLTVMRNGDRTGLVESPRDIGCIDDPAGYGPGAAAVDGGYVSACQADQRRCDFKTGSLFCPFDGMLDG